MTVQDDWHSYGAAWSLRIEADASVTLRRLEQKRRPKLRTIP